MQLELPAAIWSSVEVVTYFVHPMLSNAETQKNEKMEYTYPLATMPTRI